tara:strand:- start:503 stop:1003 length:501 start_codon:yes stop_codon:yes gene_type:complete
MKKTIFLLLFLFPNLTSAASMSMIGETGKESEVSKIIEIKMYDNYYEPNIIEVKKGETIKFVVINLGELVHEFNIATKEMHIKHQPEMMMMVEKEILLGDRIDLKKMKEAAKTNHSMAHSHSNSVLLEPKKSADLIWKFSKNAKLEAACNVPGHYDSGMVAKVNIN